MVEEEKVAKRKVSKKAEPAAVVDETAEASTTPTVEAKPKRRGIFSRRKAEEKVEKPKRTEASAVVWNVHSTPRKARLVIDLVRGKNVADAINILNNTNKFATVPVMKLIRSAYANATNNFNMDGDKLYIHTIYANDGMKLKRFLPRAKGSASGLTKRRSHIYVILKEKGE